MLGNIVLSSGAPGMDQKRAVVQAVMIILVM
jgi:hypothetical protein